MYVDPYYCKKFTPADCVVSETERNINLVGKYYSFLTHKSVVSS